MKSPVLSLLVASCAFAQKVEIESDQAADFSSSLWPSSKAG
ncbi:MAG TPA: hypothetical protein VNY05_18295 [Candidatus Acidoferrales bacterium]|nr:hypothetical protein [Candidatus Acidoferrales bacterium]